MKSRQFEHAFSSSQRPTQVLTNYISFPQANLTESSNLGSPTTVVVFIYFILAEWKWNEWLTRLYCTFSSIWCRRNIWTMGCGCVMLCQLKKKKSTIKNVIILDFSIFPILTRTNEVSIWATTSSSNSSKDHNRHRAPIIPRVDHPLIDVSLFPSGKKTKQNKIVMLLCHFIDSLKRWALSPFEFHSWAKQEHLARHIKNLLD